MREKETETEKHTQTETETQKQTQTQTQKETQTETQKETQTQTQMETQTQTESHIHVNFINGWHRLECYLCILYQWVAPFRMLSMYTLAMVITV